MIREKKKTGLRSIAFLLLLGMILPAVFLVNRTEAFAKTNIYLVLVEEKDGTWSSYEDYAEVKSAEKLMIAASDAAKAIGIKYKKVDEKKFTISNGKKVNTYTIGSVKYINNNGSKTILKKASYKAYVREESHSVMVDYNSLKTLVDVKYYDAAKAEDYHKKLGYQGVICFSKYNEITKLPPMEEGSRVTTEEEFKKAVADLETSVINVTANITLSDDFTYDREDKEVAINIKKGKTLTINKKFLAVGGSINNDGKIIINGSFERGICNLMNNGSVIINKGGMATAGMSDLNNYGTFTVKNGGELYVERGSQFYNYGNLESEGLIRIDNGGSVNNNGMIVNNGTIDLYAYFNGDISLITGSGKLNDYREGIAE